MVKKGTTAAGDEGRRRSVRGGGRNRLRQWFRTVSGTAAHDVRAWTVLFIVVLTAAISRQSCGVSYPDFRPGEIVRYDILAPFDLEVPDEETTEARRQAERARVLQVYDYDPQVGTEIRERFRESYARARALYEAAAGAGTGEKRRPSDEEVEAIRNEFNPPAPPEAYRVLAEHEFASELGTHLDSILAAVLKRWTVSNKALLPAQGGISVRDGKTGEEFVLNRLQTILDLEGARAELKGALEAGGMVRPREAEALSALLGPLLSTNLAYNAGQTEKRRADAAKNIPLLVTKIPKGKIIVRKGEEITPPVLRNLGFIEEQSGSELEILSLFGSFLLLLMVVFFIWRYATYHQRFYTRVRELYLLLLMVNLGVLLFGKVMVVLADRLTETVYLEPFNQATSYYYAIPVGACAMLITLLTNARIAMVSSVFFSVLFGMLVDWDAGLMVYALVSNFAAIFGITQYQERTALLRAGTAVGAINLITIFALDCINGTLEPLSRVGLDLACGFASGILISVLVSFCLPLLEGFFNVLTDVRLLELSNLNNPLLRKLSILAPGSYNHSVMVGTLAEAAADAIRANSLFCRVAAYYHDIGKMNHPEYYIENMQDGIYRHEGLSPTLSVLVIQNHVKEGVEMAVAEGLPQPIIDVIPQHHGTRLIRYFYEKAKQEGKPDQEIKEEDFRYPGPKPQSKETAIFMMADSVEAAARTVEDPSPARFKVVIRKIFNDIVLDRQLDECDLTFADLDRIGEAFLKRLLSIYHQRIDYPGFDFGGQSQRSASREEDRGDKVAPIRGKGWR